MQEAPSVRFVPFERPDLTAEVAMGGWPLAVRYDQMRRLRSYIAGKQPMMTCRWPQPGRRPSERPQTIPGSLL